MKILATVAAAALLTACATPQQLATQARTECAAVGRTDPQCLEQYYLMRRASQERIAATILSGAVEGLAGVAVASALPRPQAPVQTVTVQPMQFQPMPTMNPPRPTVGSWRAAPVSIRPRGH